MIIEAARGGHTAVIKCLLDYLPPNVKAAGAKAQALAKQGQAMAKAATPPGQTKTVADPKGTQQSKAASNAVLRKCRSTSTLDSGPPVAAVPVRL